MHAHGLRALDSQCRGEPAEEKRRNKRLGGLGKVVYRHLQDGDVMLAVDEDLCVVFYEGFDHLTLT